MKRKRGIEWMRFVLIPYSKAVVTCSSFWNLPRSPCVIKVEKAWLHFIQVVSVNSSVKGRIIIIIQGWFWDYWKLEHWNFRFFSLEENHAWGACVTVDPCCCAFSWKTGWPWRSNALSFSLFPTVHAAGLHLVYLVQNG